MPPINLHNFCFFLSKKSMNLNCFCDESLSPFYFWCFSTMLLKFPSNGFFLHVHVSCNAEKQRIYDFRVKCNLIFWNGISSVNLKLLFMKQSVDHLTWTHINGYLAWVSYWPFHCQPKIFIIFSDRYIVFFCADSFI